MINNEDKPGPGAYRSQSFATKKYTQKKVRGQKVKIRNTTNSSFFSSLSTRAFDSKLESNIKFHWPAAGQYDNAKGPEIGQQSLQGGAPNNFLLLKSNKSAAPFTSTVPRFQSTNAKSLQNSK